MDNNTELLMPGEGIELPDIHTLLDITPPDKIYLTSDWHFFKNHYKREANYVNTREILSWCKKNIKDDDVFIYLGDISYRWVNEEDQKQSMKLMSSIPGTKVLLIGNHDVNVGDDYCRGCGFDYIFKYINHNGIYYSHKPINVDTLPGVFLNIHGHLHNVTEYNTCDGKHNVNVYPMFYGNKPVKLSYVLSHVDELVKNHKRSSWVNIGESYRDNLPASMFGIPEEKKYPLDSDDHIRSAIKLFGHAEESKKHSLAKRIKKAADSRGISIPKKSKIATYLYESSVNINEWSMASFNPVVGIKKPYVLKMHNNTGVINTTQYAFADDIIADKYFIVNENANISLVSIDTIKDMYVEEYEFVGDLRRVKKIIEAYNNKKTVDNTFFYTALSGKPLLCEDQIDLDTQFKKIDFIAMSENEITRRESMELKFSETLNETDFSISAIPTKHVSSMIGNRSYISLREDVNGYYLYNEDTKCRTGSVERQQFITKQMVNSLR